MCPVAGARPTGDMELSQLSILAGSVATTIFVGSYLPMLVRAMRTRNLSSYSRSSLVLANIGNLVQTAYVVTLPLGPIWGLHAFYVVATLTMLVLHLRHAHPASLRETVSAEDQARDIQCPRKPRQRVREQLGLLRVGNVGAAGKFEDLRPPADDSARLPTSRRCGGTDSAAPSARTGRSISARPIAARSSSRACRAASPATGHMKGSSTAALATSGYDEELQTHRRTGPRVGEVLVDVAHRTEWSPTFRRVRRRDHGPLRLVSRAERANPSCGGHRGRSRKSATARPVLPRTAPLEESEHHEQQRHDDPELRDGVMPQLGTDLDAGQLALQPTRPDEGKRVEGEGHVVETYTDEPRPEQAPLDCLASRDHQQAERRAGDRAQDELAGDHATAHRGPVRAVHVDCGEPADVDLRPSRHEGYVRSVAFERGHRSDRRWSHGAVSARGAEAS